MRASVTRFISDSRFSNFILAVIVLNAIVLGLQTSNNLMAKAGNILELIDNICLGIFVVEILLKFFAHHLRFFKSGWNIFDFIIVGIALVPSTGGLSVLRAMRILRVLRVVSVVPSLRRVVEGFIVALPGMASVFVLMAIIFYIAGVMATKLFSETFPQWFGTLGESLYSLFQIMTLESWSMGIVRPVMVEHPQAWAFFVPFIMITTFSVVNLVVGLIVTSMEGAGDEAKAAATDGFRDEVMEKLAAIEARLEKLDK